MSRVIIATAAAFAAAPLLLIQPAQSKPIAPNEGLQTLSVPCRFYVNTLTTDATRHFSGPPIMTPSQMAHAGAIAIAQRGFDSKLAPDAFPEVVDGAAPDEKLLRWSLAEQSFTLGTPPLSAGATHAGYCAYLTDVASAVSALSAIPVPELFQHAADGAIRASRAETDPHSDLTMSRDVDAVIEDTTGEFAGIGIEIAKDPGKPLHITRAIPGNPAADAGIQAGDFLLAIDGKSTQAMTPEDLRNSTRGAVGTLVTVTIERAGGPAFDVPITRSLIRPEVVTGTLIPDTGIATIKIDVFNEHTAAQFIQTVAALATQAHTASLASGDLQQTLQILIPDVSDNPGGLKEAAELFNDLLVDQDKSGCLPITASGRSKDEDVFCADTSGPMLFNAISSFAQVVFVERSPANKTALFTYAGLLDPSAAAKGLPDLIQIGTINPITRQANVDPTIFAGLNKANIFEVLKRLAATGAVGKNGPIIDPAVIARIEQRIALEPNAASRQGLAINTVLADGTPKAALSIPAAIQNRRSASASEITTANLLDQGVTLIGRSFGKGSVQFQYPLDAEGKILTGPGSKIAALQRTTIAAFFPGSTGASDHGVGVPGMRIHHGDFRDDSSDEPREKKGLVPDAQLRKPPADPKLCTLTPKFSGALTSPSAQIPGYLLTTTARPAPASGIALPVSVLNAPLACALAVAQPETPSPFVTIAPDPGPAPGDHS